MSEPLNLPTLDDFNGNQDELSEFTRGVLAEIDEPDRPIVQKYLSTWDKKVQQEFTSRAERLKPWEELGSIEDVQEALKWIGAMNEDPVEFYKQYTQALKDNNMFPDPEKDVSNLPEFEGLPEEFVNDFRATKSELEEMKKWREQFQQETEQEKLIREVDTLMNKLHSEHGDFDDEWVLLQMQKGVDPVEAVGKFKKEIVEKYSSPRKPAPVIMPNNGQVPTNQVDFSKMTSKEKQDYMVKRLQEANAANRGN